MEVREDSLVACLPAGRFRCLADQPNNINHVFLKRYGVEKLS